MENKLKLKWNYSQKDKQWWIPESVPYANNGMSITKTANGFVLDMEYPKIHLALSKLSTAKQIANLIHNG